MDVVENKLQLHVLDYAIFVSLLFVSLAVGFYYAWKDRNQSSDSFLLNKDSMNTYAAGFSIFVSSLSALSIVGFPAQVYLYGDDLVWTGVGAILALIIFIIWFLPVIYDLRLFSIYDYYKIRYNNDFLSNCSILLGMTALLFWCSMLSYITALSLATITGMSVQSSLLLLTVIAIVYTLCGGMKAVIATDCIQSIVMLGSLTIIVISIFSKIGTREIFEISKEANGHKMADLTFSLFQKTSVGAYTAYGLTWALFQIGFSQYYVQRYVACRNVNQARICLILGLSLALFTYCLLVPAVGIGMLAYFRNCDPVQNGDIEKYDAMMPYFTTQLFKNSPGMVGLFISAAYSATMSTISTGLNSCATVIFKSLVKKRNISDTKLKRYQRTFMGLVGTVLIGSSCVYMHLADTILNIFFIIVDGFSTVLAAGFFYSILMPKMNVKGILAGYCGGLLAQVFSLMGGFFIFRPDEINPTTFRDTSQCSNGAQNLSSLLIVPEVQEIYVEHSPWKYVFWVSPLYQGAFCFTLFSLFAIPVALLTFTAGEYEMSEEFNVKLFQSKIFPVTIRSYFKVQNAERSDSKTESLLLT